MLSRTETSGDFGKVAESGGENGILNLVEILAFSIFEVFRWRFWYHFGGEKRMVIFGGENGTSPWQSRQWKIQDSTKCNASCF